MNLRPIAADGDWGALYREAHATLVARIAKHRIQHEVHYPTDDVVVVWRMPTAETKKITDGGIIIPDTSQESSVPFSIGLLLYAGVVALDDLSISGTLPGDYIKFARYAGDEEAVNRVKDVVAEAEDKARRQGLRGAALAAAEKDAEGRAIAAKSEELSKQKVLGLQAKDVHGSLDLTERLYGSKPTMELARLETPKGPMHVIRPLRRS